MEVVKRVVVAMEMLAIDQWDAGGHGGVWAYTGGQGGKTVVAMGSIDHRTGGQWDGGGHG